VEEECAEARQWKIGIGWLYGSIQPLTVPRQEELCAPLVSTPKPFTTQPFLGEMALVSQAATGTANAPSVFLTDVCLGLMDDWME